MRLLYLLFLSVFLFPTCQTRRELPTGDYPANVGDIAPDAALDDTLFKVCRENYVPQYYSVKSGFDGEKPAIAAWFRENFVKNRKHDREAGYITIRFMVNCRGETGRFRVQEAGPDLQPKRFPADLTGQLLRLTKALKGWQPGEYNGLKTDYYQYLTFKIAGGDIAAILP